MGESNEPSLSVPFPHEAGESPSTARGEDTRDDFIDAGDDDDGVLAREGAGTIEDGHGRDVVWDRGGSDRIFGEQGNDVLFENGSANFGSYAYLMMPSLEHACTRSRYLRRSARYHI